ncbi:hypothetical protein JDO7802_00007 [Jannaschia donghaensis]|uniref:Uncharacterized protein n=1 Tax=Jannaschia donghaensis TaxID=420998 RepID=A0A0M6YER5_9RHOB|nr:hypothetical protein JDO7802_00007 [Jannaschia donghaensis]
MTGLRPELLTCVNAPRVAERCLTPSPIWRMGA